MTTGLACFERVLLKLQGGLVIANTDIDALAAGSFTSANRLRRTNRWGSNEFLDRGATIFRWGAATRADFFRDAGALTVSSGAMANDANWSDTTSTGEDICLPEGYDPQDIIEAMNQSLEETLHRRMEPLSLALDPGLFSSATSFYTESDADGGAATTFTKSATAPFWGPRKGVVTNAAANGYVRSRIVISRGADIYVGVLARANTGTFELGLYDVTNSAELGTQVTTSELQWMYVWRQEAVTSGASGTETMEVRLRGDGASDVIDLNGLWIYDRSHRRLPLPSYIDRPSKLGAVGYLRFGRNRATGVEEAFSADPVEIPKAAYSFHFSATDVGGQIVQNTSSASGNYIQFHSSEYLDRPLVLYGNRPYSDDGTISTAAGTSDCPLDLWESKTRVTLLSPGGALGHLPDAPRKLIEAQRDLAQASSGLTQSNPMERANWNIGGVWN